MRLAVLIILLFFLTVLLCAAAFGAAGQITSITGPTRITRGSDFIKCELKTGVEMNDTVETLEARTNIKFADDTEVKVTEHSKLLIDSFVYDPSSGNGKIGFKAALGTLRYTSGRIARNNHNNVNVQTPTASIAVRGTDFSMAVDEMGRSLVILLPALNRKNGQYVVGKIDVTTMAGSVTLNKAFEGTYVASAQTMPSPPVILNMDEGGVGNNLLLDSPKPVFDVAKQKTDSHEKDNLNNNSIKPEDIKVIEVIDPNKFVFVEENTDAILKSSVGGNVLHISVPKTTNAQVIYKYTGGTAKAKQGSGDGVIMNITQQ